MTLPTFSSLAARRYGEKQDTTDTESPADNREIPEHNTMPTGTVDIKRATKARRTAIATACFLFSISVIFLILTLIGNINTKVVIRSTYFFKLDLANIIPASPGNIQLASSLARSLGLHDFYQVGLWSFCEGYNDEGITHCSTPKALFWFNPVEVLLSELLAGATIALPAEVNTILKLIRIASHIMFGAFLTGICMNFVSIFATPVALYSRWWSLPVVFWTGVSALLTVAGSVIGTVMAVVFKVVITGQPGLNIGASLGVPMLVFMWIASVCTSFGYLIHLCLSCCCASRRDVKTGRKRGNKAAYSSALSSEKSQSTVRRLGMAQFSRFRGKKASGQVDIVENPSPLVA